MVAVPKNQALTMLLGGNVGFAPATSASVQNGKIVLSSGWSINDTGAGYDPSSETTVDASVDIGPGNYTSNLFAIARGDWRAGAGKSQDRLPRPRRRHRVARSWTTSI